MKGITVKLPDTTLRRLGQEARAIGRSVAALIRERLEAALRRGSRSVYEITSDLAGSVEGDRKAATNDRRRFAVVITICDTGPLVAYLNRNYPYHSWAVALLAVRVDLQVAAHWPRLRTLMARYQQMDLVDASIVVMSERHLRSKVLTVDPTDFSTYRRNNRQVIDFVAPPKS